MSEPYEGKPELTPEIEATLKRYRAVQEEQKRLGEEKQELKQKILDHISTRSNMQWLVDVGGERLKIVSRPESVVKYDEDVLRQRLGNRYRAILSPDMKKIKAELPKATQLLDPIIEEIGSPDAEKVKKAFQDGVVAKEEFAGAFEKERRNRFAVMLDRQTEDRPQ